VRNPSGDKLGRIEEVLVNRTTRAIDYAVLAPNFPTNESRLVPVPWSILTYAWDQSRAGGPAGANQIFIVNLEPATLAKAPTLDRTRTTGIDPALEAANNYFVPGTGSSGTGSSTLNGAGASQPGLVGATAPANGAVVTQDPNAALSNQGQPVFIPPVGFPGVVVLDTNANQFPTNGTGTNVAGTPIPATNTGPRVPFQPGAAPPFTPFPGGTNSQVPRADPGPNDDLRRDDFSVGRPGTGSGAAPLRPRPPLQRPSNVPAPAPAPPPSPPPNTTPAAPNR
jgi:hypothetical protein